MNHYFQIGDKVKFLDDNRTATIINIFPDGTIEVVDENGIIEKVHHSEIVLADLSIAIQREKNMQKKAKKFSSIKNINLKEPFILKINKIDNEKITYYFINNTDFHIIGIISQISPMNLILPIKTLNITPNSMEEIITLEIKNYNIYNKLRLSVIPYKITEHLPIQCQDYEIKINKKKIREVLYKNEVFIPFNYIFYYKKEKKQNINIQEEKNPPPQEIDLHAEKLYKKELQQLSPPEILGIQIYNAIKFIEDHIMYGSKKCIIIHGIGEGVLKSEIHKMLEKEFKKYIQSYLEINNGGATVIYFKSYE